MALPAGVRVIANRKNLSVTLHFTANASVNVAGTSTTSDIVNSGDAPIAGAYITQVWHGSQTEWQVKRGSNTVGVFDSSAYVDFAGAGNPLNLDTSGTLVANLVGTSNGYLIIELQKINAQGTSPTANNDYFYNP
jgi:hypothetical protein